MPAEEYRVGLGMDVHPLSENRKFFLCGVCISDQFGPKGHSDGDVLSHAIADAILGAAGLPDIGTMFPEEDDRYAGISGEQILKTVANKIGQIGWNIRQVDAVLWLEEPKIAGFLPRIRSRLASALKLLPDDVGVKVKKGEGLGFIGRREGVAAWATAVLSRTQMRKKGKKEGRIHVFTDGGSKGNPGPSACAAIFVRGRNILHIFGQALGTTTNNVAEYSAVILGLRESIRLGYSKITICSDSELLIQQLNGEFQIRDEKLKRKAEEIKKLEEEGLTVLFEYVSRQKNRLAHRIVEYILERA